MKRIVTDDGKTAFTAKNCPGYSGEHPADTKALEAQTKAMNTRAETLGLSIRYTVEP